MQRPAFALLLIALTACQAPPAVVPEAAGTLTTTVPLDASAAWTPPPDACRDGATPVDVCLRDAMRAADASPAALAASAVLAERGDAGYIAAWHEIEGVGVATTEFPFRANTNRGTWLVDAAGRVVDVDADPLAGMDDTQAGITTFRAAHADARPVAPARFEAAEPLEGGGVRLIYATPMRTCHACEDIGTLRIGYDFDPARRFTGRHLLTLG
ncbi:hypothetical protein [Luteimonas deserti]|uniref:Lipoprotein n=1 Tax=Luteimonas deserti TaxID=2752306 RepID=A0A7Z0TWH6_9GAMM|nr:hypothetical protein [Luteimonas deserti]NYZ63379.1 hypothetical protein [Luteimonas deserti]